MDIDELIDQAARTAGLPHPAVRAGVLGALGLLEVHAGPDATRRLYDAVPGAEAAATSPEARPKGGGGLFGGLMKSAGGVSGRAMGDAMGLMERVKREGLDREDLKRLIPVLRDIVQRRTGQDLLGDAVKTVPGVGTLLGAG